MQVTIPTQLCEAHASGHKINPRNVARIFLWLCAKFCNIAQFTSGRKRPATSINWS